MRLGLGIVVLAVVVCAALVFDPFSGPDADASEAAHVEGGAPRSGPRVQVAKADLGSLEQSFSTYGDLVAVKRADIASQIDGRIASIPVSDGAEVKHGQVLLTLDDAVAEADLKAAKAKLKAAKADFKRVSTLVKRGTSTALALEKAQVKLAVAETEMELKKAERERYTIRAPFDGRLTQLDLQPGAFIMAGKPLAQIYSHKQMRVEFHVPERLWSKLKTGQTFTVRIDGDTKLSARGRVTYVSPDANPKSRSLTVAGLIDNKDQRFAPGLFAHIRLDLGAKSNVVLVPESAVVEKLSGSYVFVIENGKSRERKVELGERRSGKVEVVSGVKQGQQVVVRGQKRIRDNMVVTVASGPSKS